VNPDPERDSLAKRAAAWVPPWQRPTVASANGSDNDAGESDDAIDNADELDNADDLGNAGELGNADDLEIGHADAGVDDMSEAAAREVDTDPDTAAARTRADSPARPTDAMAPLIDDAIAVIAESVDEPLDDLVDEPLDEPIDEPVELRKPIGKAPQLPRRPPSDTELGPAIEAILLVIDEPVTAEQLGDVLDVPAAAVAECLDALAADYNKSGRGFDLRRVSGGWRFYTRGTYAPYVERFVLDGQSVRLTQAALETLAVVAYRQPVTRSRISAIRGVNCDGVVRTLVTRGLIEECGTQPETGAYLYRTTELFLEKLGLDSVDQLPPLAPFLPDNIDGLSDAEL